jgi:mono/diheme cytochrome c family protein
MKRISLAVVGLILSTGLAAWSQEPTAGTEQKKEIKKVPIKSTGAESGKKMFVEYCAVCHGKGGKGDGPAVSALKAQPADLTALAKANNGKFPSAHVAEILRSGSSIAAHGTSEMPIWGRVLSTSSAQGTNATELQLRIRNLTEYIETLQSK